MFSPLRIPHTFTYSLPFHVDVAQRGFFLSSVGCGRFPVTCAQQLAGVFSTSL